VSTDNATSEVPSQLPPLRDGAVAQEQPDEPRISRLSGKVIEPVKKRPEIRVDVVLKNEFHDAEGPIARRAVPRPEVADAGPTDDNPDLTAIEAALHRDDNVARDAVAAMQTELRNTVLKDIRATAKAVAEFQAEHGAFFARTAAALANGELLAKAGSSSRDRVHRLDRLVGDVVRLFNRAPGMVANAEKLINEIVPEELRPMMTSAGGGRTIDGFAIPARTKIERIASGFRRDGVLRDLNEKLEQSKIIVAELAERIAANETTNKNARPSNPTILRPEELDMREAGRPTPPTRWAANSGDGTRPEHADWNPLDYEVRR